MTNEELIEELCRRLEDAAEVSDQTRQAIDAGDDARVQDLLALMQSLLGQVDQANRAAQSVPPSALVPAILVRMRNASNRVRSGTEAANSWLKSHGPEVAQVERTKGDLPDDWKHHQDVLVLAGTGGGEIARRVISRGQEHLFVLLPEGVDSDDLPHKVVVAHDLDELRHALLSIPGRVPRRGIVQRLPDERIKTSLLIEISKLLHECLITMDADRNTAVHFGPQWLLQCVENLPQIASWPSIGALAGAFRDKPCVIVSPGPSLDKNVHLLPAIKDRALVITSNHTVHAVLKAGVTPDIILTLDAQDLRSHFEGYPIEQAGALAVGVTSHPGLFHLPARRILSFAASSILDDWVYAALGDAARIPGGGSVSCAAIALAAYWECKPIMLVGQDLAFSGDKYYSKLSLDGTVRVAVDSNQDTFKFEGHTTKALSPDSDRRTKELSYRMEEVPGYYGGTVKTSSILSIFRRWIEHSAKNTGNRNQIINCTEGGAYIKGVDHIPLATALEEHVGAPLGIEQTLDGATASINPQDRRRKMHRQVESMIAAIDKSVQLARDCLRLTDKVRLRPERLNMLDDKEKQLVTSLQSVLFISLLQQAQILDAREEGKFAKNMSESLSASRKLYEVIIEGGRVLRPRLVESLGRLHEASIN